jgi:hypothetical protein
MVGEVGSVGTLGVGADGTVGTVGIVDSVVHITHHHTSHIQNQCHKRRFIIPDDDCFDFDCERPINRLA